MKKVTMQDIADRLGITKVSVSKALNGQPGISAQTRARILEAAVQMGYAGRARETDRPKRFAMLVAKRFFLETDGFYTEIAYHLNAFSLRDGHQIYTVVLSAEAEEALELPDALQAPLFDGIFLTTPRTRTSTMVWTWCSTASRAGSSTTRTRRSA